MLAMNKPKKTARAARKERSTVKTTRTAKPSEADLQAYFTGLLEHDGWRALRTDPTSDRGRAKGFGEIGMADHLYIRYLYDAKFTIQRSEASLLWCEFKTPTGKYSTAQLDWHLLERKRGALTLMVGIDCEATPEGMYAWYKTSGLMRKNIE